MCRTQSFLAAMITSLRHMCAHNTTSRMAARNCSMKLWGKPWILFWHSSECSGALQERSCYCVTGRRLVCIEIRIFFFLLFKVFDISHFLSSCFFEQTTTVDMRTSFSKVMTQLHKGAWEPSRPPEPSRCIGHVTFGVRSQLVFFYFHILWLAISL